MEDYEKKYEEALERAKKIHDEHKAQCADIMLTVFPELKESEDERINKHLKVILERYITYIEDDEAAPDVKDLLINNAKDCLSWLEKQGEMDMESYKTAEDEKREFVGDSFIKCYADFQDFKEGETYWLEYIGNDNYNVRSDNLLGKTYHITPCQLYTIFKKQTWLEKQGEQEKLNAYIDKLASDTIYNDENGNPIDKDLMAFASKVAFSMIPATKTESYHHLNRGRISDAVIKGAQWEKKQGEQKPTEWSEEDLQMLQDVISGLEATKQLTYAHEPQGKAQMQERIDWLKSLRPQSHWNPSDEQMEVLNWCKPLWNEPKTKAVLESLIEDLKKLKE